MASFSIALFHYPAFASAANHRRGLRRGRDRCNHVHHSIKCSASESAGYSDLLPSRSVQAMIDARIRELSASYCAIHVRRTGHAVRRPHAL